MTGPMFRGPLEFLSNFSQYGCVLDGQWYPTVENAFQAAKLAYPSDRIEHFRLHQVSPAEAKMIGRSVPLRPDWEVIKLKIMRQLLASKFSSAEGLSDLLLMTTDQILVETNTWHDQIWGDCYCPQHAGTPGRNLLGKSLMQLRSYLRGES